MSSTKILSFAGSARTGSVNKKLAKFSAKIAEEQGFEANFIDLKDYPLPLYDGDLEEKDGVPENAEKLKDLIQSHQGIFIACPEYNSSITPLLKNTLDWISRTKNSDGSSATPFKNNIVALGAASPGGLGGMRVLLGIRPILSNGYSAFIIPEQISVGNAFKAFDEQGNLTEERLLNMLHNVISRLGNQASKA